MRFHRLRPAIIIVLMSFGLVACNGKAVQNSGDTKSGVSVSSFEATDINGDDVTLSDHLGKDVVVMSFWSTWCEPCKAEMPTLQKLENRFGGKGLKILSISTDGPDTQAEVKPYIRSNRYTFTVIIDEDSSIAQAFNPRSALPFMVIIDKRGQVIKKIEGFQISEASHLIANIAKLVAAK